MASLRIIIINANIKLLNDLGKNFIRYYSNATFDLEPFKLHRLDKGPDVKVTVNSEEALRYYSKMNAIRRLENTCANFYKEKVIRGFCHLYSGQEAIAVGVKSAMRKNDYAISAYRVHGWTYVMGASIESILAEVCGRATGTSRGKGGSMHTYTSHFLGGHGIVGAQVPMGTGVALVLKYLGKDGVCFAIYGDGAANQGQVFEAFNMAKLWSLPVIFLCENNKYAMGTPIERAAAATDFYTRGDYIPGLQVDGMDVLATREASLFAIAHCVSDRGPILLEMMTYRYSGHSMSDPGTSYRTREEIQSIRQSRDPITVFKDKIVKAKLVTEEELKAEENKTKLLVEEATARVRAAPAPAEKELTADVYAESFEPAIRGISPWEMHKHFQFSKPF